MPEILVRARDQLVWAVAVLREAGVEHPRREAVRLWSAVTDAGSAGGGRGGGRRSETPLPRFWRAVNQRAQGMPWQYAAGIAGFRHLDLRCDPRALIPRPETEGLVDLALTLCRTGRALDLGTGGGCVALALAAEGDFEEVVGTDCSADALELARENARWWDLPVRWVQGDWTAPLPGQRFDLVVSNPPYIASAELAGLEPPVREWEPPLALDGGPDGLQAIDRLLQEVPGVLASGGVMALELDSRRAVEAAARAASRGWHDVTITQDLFGRDRYLTARREPSS